jgi:predicted transcriptional regulator
MKENILMNTLKEATIESIKRLPDECSLEDIMYQINFIAQVLEGLEDAKAGRSISTEELLEKVELW